MTEPWTPGPWKAVKPDWRGWVVKGPEWEYEVDTEPTLSEADARLVAAAPEMADLLSIIAARGFQRAWDDHMDIEVRGLLTRIRGD